MTHSPEPWISECNRMGNTIGHDPDGFSHDPDGFSGELKCIGNTAIPEDAERIVACVNACKHLPTKFLENHGDGLDAAGLTMAKMHVPEMRD